MYTFKRVFISVFLISNTFVYSIDQQAQLMIAVSIPVIAEIEFYETDAFFLDLRIEKARRYLAKIHLKTNTGYMVFVASKHGGTLVDTTVGNYAVPYTLFYDDTSVEFDESGVYQIIVDKESNEIHAEIERSGKTVELSISYEGKPAFPKEIYRDIVTILIESSTSSGEFAGMSHILHIRGFVDSQQK